MDHIAHLQRLTQQRPEAPFGLPGAFYTCPDWYRHETQSLLANSWHCLGRADEIPNPGDYITEQLLDEPLLVVRGDDAQIRVLANLCRHRGLPVAEGHGSAKRFVCAYHAWTYGRDGALLRAPRMDNAGFDPATCRLPQHAVQVWNGFIYTNLSVDAAPFSTPKTDALLAPYETSTFRMVHRAEEIWHCNWKCLVENFMEGYHLSVVHPQTLHGYTPTGLAQKLPNDPGTTAYAANYPETIAPRGAGAPGLSAEERHRSTLFALFPGQVASQAANLLVSLSLFPEGPAKVRVKWTMSVYGDELTADDIASRIALWTEVNREDREKLERLQQALGSRHAVAGPLAAPDYEGTIRDFHLWLAQQMGTA